MSGIKRWGLLSTLINSPAQKTQAIAMIKGSCLCGSVRFEITKAVGPFEICHCSRCRKVSGANGVPGLGVLGQDFVLTSGADCILTYQAPILYAAPAYETYFCKTCGSPTPPPEPTEFFEIPAGLLDNDPGRTPDKHIFVEFMPEWDQISDKLPQYSFRQLYELRHGKPLPEEFEIKKHRVATPDD